MNITDISHPFWRRGASRQTAGEIALRLITSCVSKDPQKNRQLMHWWWVDLCDEHFHGHNWLNVKILQHKIRQYELFFFLKPFFYLDPSFYITVIVLNMPKKCFSVFSGASPASKRGPWPGSDETDFCVARDWSNVERDGGTLGGCAECVPGTLSQGEGFLKDFWGLLESNYTPWKLTAKAPCLKNGWLEFLIVSFGMAYFSGVNCQFQGVHLLKFFGCFESRKLWRFAFWLASRRQDQKLGR